MDKRIQEYYEKYELDRFFSTDITEHLHLASFERGETICSSEEPLNRLYFFVEGFAKASIALENGRQLLLSFNEPLQIFGEFEIFDEDAVATSTIEALRPCICLYLEKNVVLRQLDNDPKFLKQMFFSLRKKLDRVIKNGAINMLTALDNRVASYILATSQPDADQHLIFTANLTLVAEQLGTSFRHLHRTLQSFCDAGILRKENTTYVVLSKPELEHRAVGVYKV